jgi:hypothetical protein
MEARNQGPEGIGAVLQVIMNRSHFRRLDVRQIILEYRQFSWTNSDDPQFGPGLEHSLAIIKGHPLDSRLNYCITRAEAFLDGNGTCPEVKNATHYFNPKVTDPIRDGRWDKNKMEYCATIGGHVFYHEKGYGGLQREEKN